MDDLLPEIQPSISLMCIMESLVGTQGYSCTYPLRKWDIGEIINPESDLEEKSYPESFLHCLRQGTRRTFPPVDKQSVQFSGNCCEDSQIVLFQICPIPHRFVYKSVGNVWFKDGAKSPRLSSNDAQKGSGSGSCFTNSTMWPGV